MKPHYEEDEHVSCRAAIARAHRQCEERCIVREVVQQLPFGKGSIVLKVIHVDESVHGIRIVVE